MLGYKTYHAAELRNTPPGTHALWIEALTAKYSSHLHGSKPSDLPKAKCGKFEFDRLLAGYTAVTDIPWIIFAEELLAAYPDAKVQHIGHDKD